MKIVKDRMIKERVPLSECQPGDLLYVSYSKNNSWNRLNHIELVKLKTIPNGFIQMKYRKRYLTGAAKVHKVDLPPYALVERTRKADHRDRASTTVCTAEIISA